VFGWLKRPKATPVVREARQDPVLGPISPVDAAPEWFVQVPGSDVTISIAGVAEPRQDMLAHAREIVGSFAEFRRRIAQFLQEQARTMPAWAPEIAQLELETIYLWAPDAGMIYFRGPDEYRVWRCDYAGGLPVGLGFDS
jgi:hypothetical protein